MKCSRLRLRTLDKTIAGRVTPLCFCTPVWPQNMWLTKLYANNSQLLALVWSQMLFCFLIFLSSTPLSFPHSKNPAWSNICWLSVTIFWTPAIEPTAAGRPWYCLPEQLKAEHYRLKVTMLKKRNLNHFIYPTGGCWQWKDKPVTVIINQSHLPGKEVRRWWERWWKAVFPLGYETCPPSKPNRKWVFQTALSVRCDWEDHHRMARLKHSGLYNFLNKHTFCVSHAV